MIGHLTEVSHAPFLVFCCCCCFSPVSLSQGQAQNARLQSEPLSQGLSLWQFPGTPYFPFPSSKPTWLMPISLATCYPLSRKPPGKEPLQIQFLEQGPGSSFLPSMSGLCFAQRFHRNFSCPRKTNGGSTWDERDLPAPSLW